MPLSSVTVRERNSSMFCKPPPVREKLPPTRMLLLSLTVLPALTVMLPPTLMRAGSLPELPLSVVVRSYSSMSHWLAAITGLPSSGT
ncbi:hypothetical protein D9M69_614860 [compost metagenome]